MSAVPTIQQQNNSFVASLTPAQQALLDQANQFTGPRSTNLWDQFYASLNPQQQALYNGSGVAVNVGGQAYSTQTLANRSAANLPNPGDTGIDKFNNVMGGTVVPLVATSLIGAGVGSAVSGIVGGGVLGSTLGGAAGGATNAAVTGKNIGTGALTGGVGGLVGSGLNAIETSTGALDPLGTTGIKAINTAAGGAAGAALSGGNPVSGAISGGLGALGASLGGDLAGPIGSSVGKTVGKTLATDITGGSTPIASTTAGGKVADPIQPMGGTETGTAPATVPSVASPTVTATQGLPTTGIPNGSAALTPAGLISGTGLSSSSSPATATTGLPDPGASSTAGTTPTDTTSSLLSDIGTGIGAVGSALLGGNSLTSMAPYLAIGALGFSQADQAKKDAQAQADKVAALGTPYTQAGTQLLSQYQSGTLTPAQQSVVDTATKQGNTLLASDPQLQAIYTQAFGNYASGTLRPADQLALDQSVAAQKAQVRQNLSSMGITDSTILAAQDQQINNNAIMQKQQLLDAQFQTGDQAFTQWAQTTQAGQALILEGQQYAVTSLQQTLNNALQAGQTGMTPVIQSVQMQIAADAQLGTAVSDLLGNLAKAYAYQSYQKNNAAGGSSAGGAAGAAGAAGNLLSKIGGSTGQTGGGITIPTNSSTGLPTSAAGGATGALVGAAGGASGGNVNVPSTGNTMGGSSTDVVGGGSAVTDPTTGLPYGQTAPDISQNPLDQATQDQLNNIYSGSFNPSTSDTSSLVNYVSYSGY